MLLFGSLARNSRRWIDKIVRKNVKICFIYLITRILVKQVVSSTACLIAWWRLNAEFLFSGITYDLHTMPLLVYFGLKSKINNTYSHFRDCTEEIERTYKIIQSLAVVIVNSCEGSNVLVIPEYSPLSLLPSLARRDCDITIITSDSRSIVSTSPKLQLLVVKECRQYLWSSTTIRWFKIFKQLYPTGV